MGWEGRAARNLVKLAGGAETRWSCGRRWRKRRLRWREPSTMALLPC
jgi:hypothetical protein